MPTNITEMSDINLIILENTPPVEIPDVVLENTRQSAAFKQKLGTPIYRILDVSKVDLQFSDMMVAMGAERGMEGGSSDPDVTTLFVGSGELVKMGTKALAEQDQYGKARVHLFTTQEEAIQFARANPLS